VDKHADDIMNEADIILLPTINDLNSIMKSQILIKAFKHKTILVFANMIENKRDYETIKSEIHRYFPNLAFTHLRRTKLLKNALETGKSATELFESSKQTQYVYRHAFEEYTKIFNDVDVPITQIEDLWERNKSRYGITVDRSARYLNWRLKENPYHNHIFLCYYDNDKLIGYVVLVLELNTFHIIDIFANGKKKQIWLLMLNLISNAVKYIGKRNPCPQIQIGTKLIDGKQTVFIKDNGIGIDKDYKEKIFEIFQRSPNAKKEAEGTGVGLFVAKTIVEEHKGKIWVEPNPQKGCTFFVYIPEKRDESSQDSDN
jgi:hypothetical protein